MSADPFAGFEPEGARRAEPADEPIAAPAPDAEAADPFGGFEPRGAAAGEPAAPVAGAEPAEAPELLGNELAAYLPGTLTARASESGQGRMGLAPPRRRVNPLSFDLAPTISPERAKKALEDAWQAGVPSDIAFRDPERVETLLARRALKLSMPELSESRSLSDAFEDPLEGAAIHKDLPAWLALRRSLVRGDRPLVETVPERWARGEKLDRSAELVYGQMFRTATPEQEDEWETIQQGLGAPIGEKRLPGEYPPWLTPEQGQALDDLARQLEGEQEPGQVTKFLGAAAEMGRGSFIPLAREGGIGAIVAGAVPATAALIAAGLGNAPAAALAGSQVVPWMTAGAGAKGVEQAYRMNLAETWPVVEGLQSVDAEGQKQPIPREALIGAALASAAVKSGLDFPGFFAFRGLLAPVLQKALGGSAKGLAAALAEVAADKGTMTALAIFGVQYGKAVATESVTEFAQAFPDVAVAKGLPELAGPEGVTRKTLTIAAEKAWEGVVAAVPEAIEEGKEAVRAMAVFGWLAGVTRGVMHGLGRIAESQADAARMERFNQRLEPLREMFEKSPEAARKLVQGITDEVGAGSVYMEPSAIPPGALAKLSPAVRRELLDAAGEGRLAEIPTGEYAVHVAPLLKPSTAEGAPGVAPSGPAAQQAPTEVAAPAVAKAAPAASFSPDTLTPDEQTERQESAPAELAARMGVIDSERDQARIPEADTYAREVQDALLVAGLPLEDAAAGATILRTGLLTRARREGLSIEQARATFPSLSFRGRGNAAVRMARPDLADAPVRNLARERRLAELTAAVADLRSPAEVRPAKRFPVLDTLRRSGGVAPGSPLWGELRAMGLTARHMPGLMRKRWLESADNIVADEHPLLQHRIPLAEGTGYFDERALLEAIREELAGRPIEAEDVLGAREEQDRAKAELEQALADAGIDLAAATDAEAAAALLSAESAAATAAVDELFQAQVPEEVQGGEAVYTVRAPRVPGERPAAADLPGSAPLQLSLFDYAGPDTPAALAEEGAEAAGQALVRLAGAGEVTLARVGSFATGLTNVSTPEEVAHLTAPLRKDPQEQLLFVVTDEQGEVLRVIAGSRGTRNAALVPVAEGLGAAMDTPGAKNLWMVHNHPSGPTTPSEQDGLVTHALGALASRSGLVLRGSLVVAPGQRHASIVGAVLPGYVSEESASFEIEPHARVRVVDIFARRWKKSPSTEGADIPRLSDHATKEEYDAALRSYWIEQMPEDVPGLLFLDSMAKALGFLPMSEDEMRVLRTESLASGLARVARAVSGLNADFIVAQLEFGPEGGIRQEARAAVQNLATFAHLLFRPQPGEARALLEVLDTRTGRQFENLPQPGRTFMQPARPQPTVAELTAEIEAIDRELADVNAILAGEDVRASGRRNQDAEGRAAELEERRAELRVELDYQSQRTRERQEAQRAEDAYFARGGAAESPDETRDLARIVAPRSVATEQREELQRVERDLGRHAREIRSYRAAAQDQRRQSQNENADRYDWRAEQGEQEIERLLVQRRELRDELQMHPAEAESQPQGFMPADFAEEAPVVGGATDPDAMFEQQRAEARIRMERILRAERERWVEESQQSDYGGPRGQPPDGGTYTREAERRHAREQIARVDRQLAEYGMAGPVQTAAYAGQQPRADDPLLENAERLRRRMAVEQQRADAARSRHRIEDEQRNAQRLAELRGQDRRLSLSRRGVVADLAAPGLREGERVRLEWELSAIDAELAAIFAEEIRLQGITSEEIAEERAIMRLPPEEASRATVLQSRIHDLNVEMVALAEQTRGLPPDATLRVLNPQRIERLRAERDRQIEELAALSPIPQARYRGVRVRLQRDAEGLAIRPVHDIQGHLRRERGAAEAGERQGEDSAATVASLEQELRESAENLAQDLAQRAIDAANGDAEAGLVGLRQALTGQIERAEDSAAEYRAVALAEETRPTRGSWRSPSRASRLLFEGRPWQESIGEERRNPGLTVDEEWNRTAEELSAGDAYWVGRLPEGANLDEHRRLLRAHLGRVSRQWAATRIEMFVSEGRTVEQAVEDTQRPTLEVLESRETAPFYVEKARQIYAAARALLPGLSALHPPSPQALEAERNAVAMEELEQSLRMQLAAVEAMTPADFEAPEGGETLYQPSRDDLGPPPPRSRAPVNFNVSEPYRSQKRNEVLIEVVGSLVHRLEALTDQIVARVPSFRKHPTAREYFVIDRAELGPWLEASGELGIAPLVDNVILYEEGRRGPRPGERAPPRGSIEFPDPYMSRAIVSFLTAPDRSTQFHELGHLYTLSLLHRASQPNAPAWLLRDAEILRGFAGATPGLDLTEEQKEKLASAFWVYLGTGRAPSKALRPVFARMRQWFMELAETVRDLIGMDALPDDVRGVFERMLATDEEIAAVREDELGGSIFAPGQLSEQERAAIEEAMAASAAATRSELDRIQLQELGRRTGIFEKIAKERERRLAEARERIREEVTREVERMQVWRADHYLRTGQLLGMATPEGLPVAKISRPIIVELFGPGTPAAEAILAVPTGSRSWLSVTKGVHPDELAEQLGYDTGADLVKALLVAGSKEAGSRQRVIEAETDKRTRALGTLPAGELEAAARVAFRTEARMQLQIIEDRLLSARTGNPTVEGLRERAASIVAAKQYRALNPAMHRSIARKSRRLALLANNTGDFTAAQVHLRRGFLHELMELESMERIKRDDAIFARARAFDRNPKLRKEIGLAGHGYLDTMDWILEQVELRVIPMIRARRSALAFGEWLDEREESGDAILVPDWITERGGIHWRTMTGDEIEGLGALLESIANAAKASRFTMVGTERIERTEQRRAIADELTRGVIRPATVSGHITEDQRLTMEGVFKALGGHDARELGDMLFKGGRSLQAMLVGKEALIWSLVGADPTSMFYQTVIARLQAAYAMHSDRMRNLVEPVQQLAQRFLGRRGRQRYTELLPEDRLSNRFTHDGVPVPFKLTRFELLSIGHNIGNDSNLAKLVGGFGWWDTRDLDGARAWLVAILDDHLDAEDWQYLQGVGDLLETLKPEVFAHEERVSGVAPEAVEPQAFTTPVSGQELRGWYFPVVYDPTRSEPAAQREVERGLLASPIGLGRVETSHPFTKARTGLETRALRLDGIGILMDHLESVSRDLSFRIPLLDIYKTLNDAGLQDVFRGKLGPEFTLTTFWKPWLQTMAGMRNNPGGLRWFEKTALSARRKASAYVLLWRTTTVLVQWLGLLSGLQGLVASVEGAKVGTGKRHLIASRALARGIWDSLGQGSWQEMTRIRAAAMAESNILRTRLEAYDREMMDLREQIRGRTGLAPWAIKLGARLIAGMQLHVVDLPVYLATKRLEIDKGRGEEHARQASDTMVATTQGAGHALSQAEIFTAFDALKSSLTFLGTYQNTLLNQVAGEWRSHHSVASTSAAILTVAMANAALAYAMRQLYYAAIRPLGLATPEPPDDPEELAEEMAKEALGGVAGLIPGVYDMLRSARYGKPAAPGWIGVWQKEVVRSVRAAGTLVSEGDYEEAFWAALRMSALSAGVPADYLTQTAEKTLGDEDEGRQPWQRPYGTSGGSRGTSKRKGD